MSKIALSLPTQAKVTGSLRSRAKTHNLLQDMLQIELPGKVFIDVGWYPDWDPSGEYRLIVFHENPEKQIEPQLCTRNVATVRDAIYRMIKKHLVPIKLLNANSLVVPPILFNGRIAGAPQNLTAIRDITTTSILRVTL